MKLGNIMHIFLQISLKRDNSRSSENKMERRWGALVHFCPSEKETHSGKAWDEILGALKFNLAQAIKLSLKLACKKHLKLKT